MKYNRLHIILGFVAILATMFAVDSCKSKKQEIPPFIDVHLEVKDVNNKPSSGATAYLYNSQTAFQAAYQNSLNLIYNSDGSILTTTVSNGTVDLQGLPSNTEYWILVHDTSDFFRDSNGNIITGFKVDKDNSEAYYKIDGFQNGTTVLANVTLQPVTSLIQFNNNSNVSSFDRVELGKSVISNLPTGGYKKVRKGDISYMARTSDCIWTGAIDAQGGIAVSEDLVVCSSRVVTFSHLFSLYEKDNGMLIRIFIGQNSKDGSGGQLKPALVLSSTNSSQSIVLANDSKTYTYFAEFVNPTATHKCVWQKDITSSSVDLAACN